MPSGSRNYNRRTRGSTLPLRERKRLRVHSYPLALRPEQPVAECTAACDENALHGVANPPGQKRRKACCASLYDRMRTPANFYNAPRRTRTFDPLIKSRAENSALDAANAGRIEGCATEDELVLKWFRPDSGPKLPQNCHKAATCRSRIRPPDRPALTVFRGPPGADPRRRFLSRHKG